jgi:hypothetical protein
MKSDAVYQNSFGVTAGFIFWGFDGIESCVYWYVGL